MDGTVLKGIKGYLKDLHDFTHGGSIQIRARNTLNEVTSNYKPEHIAALVSASAALSLKTTVAIAGAVEDTELANRLFQEYKKIERRRSVKGYVVGRPPQNLSVAARLQLERAKPSEVLEELVQKVKKVDRKKP